MCLVQEPQCFNGKLINQPNSCNKFMVRGDCRTIIYSSKNVNCWFLENLTSKDVAVIQTKINKKPTIIISAYFDITNKEVISTELIKAIEYADAKNMGLLIGLDSNSHSTAFGPTNNKRGELLDEFIAKYDLQIENNSHTPTFESRGAKTCIDVTFTKRLSVTCKDWRVNQDFNGSDHNTIEFYMDRETMEIPERPLWHKADWDLFKKESNKQINMTVPEVITEKQLDEVVENLYKGIQKCIDIAVPKAKPKIIDCNNPWWNDNLERMRKQVRQLYKTSIKPRTEGT